MESQIEKTNVKKSNASTQTSNAASQTNSNLLQYFNTNIGHNRIIEVLYYQGNSYVDIVTFEKSPSGNYSKISSKSIRIPLLSVKLIYQNIERIIQHFEVAKSGEETEYSLHLGGLLMLRLDRNIKCVDFRKHYLPPSSPAIIENIRPGIPGVGLKFCEFDEFLKLLDQLGEITNIDSVVSCIDKEDHLIGSVLDNCKFCNPQKIFY